MSTRKLIAIKTHAYGTRRLRAGDEFEVPGGEARLWVALGKARYAAEASKRPPVEVPPPTLPVRAAPEPAVVAAVEQMESLRAQAEALGIEVDGRWGVPRLRYEIAKATPGGKDAAPAVER